MALPKFNVNLILLGNGECGKSSFIRAFIQGLRATQISEDNFEISRRDRQYNVRVYENTLNAQNVSEAATVAIYCFDIGDRTSLQSVQQYWHQEVIKLMPGSVDALPDMLLGLKRDKRAAGPVGLVDSQEALKFAGEMRISMYAECSVSAGDLMRQVAEDVLKLLRVAVDRKMSGSDTYSYCIIS